MTKLIDKPLTDLQNKFEGSGNELLNDPEVRRSFLGA